MKPITTINQTKHNVYQFIPPAFSILFAFCGCFFFFLKSLGALAVGFSFANGVRVDTHIDVKTGGGIWTLFHNSGFAFKWTINFHSETTRVTICTSTRGLTFGDDATTWFCAYIESHIDV